MLGFALVTVKALLDVPVMSEVKICSTDAHNVWDQVMLNDCATLVSDTLLLNVLILCGIHFC